MLHPFRTKDVVRILVDDESAAGDGAEVRGLRYDIHRALHALHQSHVLGPAALRPARRPRRRLDSHLQFRLELLAGPSRR